MIATSTLVLNFWAFMALGSVEVFPFGYLAGGRTMQLFVTVATVFGLAFAPTFLVAGMMEFLVLRDGVRRGMSYGAVYGLMLGGSLIGLVIGYGLIAHVGALSLYLVSVACMLSAAVAVSRHGVAAVLLLATLGAAVASADDRTDDWFVWSLVDAGQWREASRYADAGQQVEHMEWGKYAHFMLMRDPEAGHVTGFYNGYPYWSAFEEHSPSPNFTWDELIGGLVDPGSHVAIMGGGGGRQVHAIRAGCPDCTFDVFELEPAVNQLLRDERPELVGGILTADGVNTVTMDARQGVANADRPYDCIFASSVGSPITLYKNLLLGSNYLYTAEAFDDYAAQLAEGGFFTLHMPRMMFDGGFGQRIVNHLERVGLQHLAWTSEKYGYIVAARPQALARLSARLRDLLDDYAMGEATVDHAALLPMELPVDLTVDNPLPSDNWNSVLVFSLVSWRALASIVGAIAIGVAVLVWAIPFVIAAYRRRRARAPLGRRPMTQILLLGIHFILLENMLIFEMSRRLLDMTDAVIIGSVMFLVPSMVGAALSTRLSRTSLAWVHAVGVALSLALLASGAFSGSLALLAVEAVVFLTSGALFPIVLERSAASALAALFALDSVGSLLGTVLLGFLPVIVGIDQVAAISLSFTGLVGLYILLDRTPPAGAQQPSSA